MIKLRDTRKAFYKYYKMGINNTDGVDTTLIIIMVEAGFAVPIMLPWTLLLLCVWGGGG